jgi:N-acetylmuramoyl-L-alanine amidase
MHPGRKPQHPVSGLVLHFTAAGSGKGTADYFSKREVSWTDKATGQPKTAKVSASAHLTIDRDGTVYQSVSFADRAWHAGPATLWKGKPTPTNVNDFSIGIEIANWGKLSEGPPYKTYTGTAFKGTPFVAKDGSVWEAYPEAQVLAVIQATKVIIAKFSAITRDNVTGHENIQSNKNDPGPGWPWERFLDAVFGDDDEQAASLDAAEDDDRAGFYDEKAEMCLDPNQAQSKEPLA